MTGARQSGGVPSQLSPHHATRTTLESPNGPLAALRGPEPTDERATALLVPGYTGSKEDFAPLLDGLADAGLLPVAVDLPGQYESPGPEDETRYLPAELGRVVAALVEKLTAEGGPVLLLGHSNGGLVARAAVLAGAPVAGLTLLDSGPGALPDGARRAALDVGDPLLRTRGLAASYAVREELSARNPRWLAMPSELRAFLRDRFVASSAASLLGMAEGLRTEPDRVDELAARLRERAVPALVVAGEHDDAWAVPTQEEMARRLGAPFERVSGAAHSPNTENPDELVAVLTRHWRGWLAA